MELGYCQYQKKLLLHNFWFHFISLFSVVCLCLVNRIPYTWTFVLYLPKYILLYQLDLTGVVIFHKKMHLLCWVGRRPAYAKCCWCITKVKLKFNWFDFIMAWGREDKNKHMILPAFLGKYLNANLFWKMFCIKISISKFHFFTLMLLCSLFVFTYCRSINQTKLVIL